MRMILLASATLFSLGAALPAFAQSAGSSADGAAWPYAHQPGTGLSGPASSKASNIDGTDSNSAIAPHLPSPAIGQNGSPEQYLSIADHALDQHHTGAAQQALEMAETRLLDRSTPMNAANRPDQNPEIRHVDAALRALGNGNYMMARHAIQQALAHAPGNGGKPAAT